MPDEKFSALDPDIIIMAKKMGINQADDVLTGTRGVFLSISNSNRAETLVNCWHQNSKFSPKMWEDYAKCGVYIKTNPLRIFYAIPEKLRCLFDKADAGLCLLSKVKYIDSHDSISNTEVTNIVYGNKEHTLKLEEFSHESEYRLIISEVTLGVMTNIRLNRYTAVRADDLQTLELNEKDIILDGEPYNSKGLYIKVDSSKLIHEIGIVGNSNLKEIKRKCMQSGFN